MNATLLNGRPYMYIAFTYAYTYGFTGEQTFVHSAPMHIRVSTYADAKYQRGSTKAWKRGTL